MSVSIFKFIQRTSDRGGSSFITFSHPLPRAACRALMACRNIITALMHTLKLSSYDLISSVFQDSVPCFQRDHLHILNFLLCLIGASTFQMLTFFKNVFIYLFIHFLTSSEILSSSKEIVICAPGQTTCCLTA